MNDEYRDTMYFASLKRRFVREKQVTKTEYEDLTLEEVKAAMLDRIVTGLYCTPWSEKKPLIIIAKRISPSEGGVWMYYESWAEHTPKFYTWEKFYRELVSAGLYSWKF